jgi:hypothetical protein
MFENASRLSYAAGETNVEMNIAMMRCGSITNYYPSAIDAVPGPS